MCKTGPDITTNPSDCTIYTLYMAISLTLFHISCEEFSTFQQLMPVSTYHFSFHHVPITARWIGVVWNEKIAQHFYTLPAE